MEMQVYLKKNGNASSLAQVLYLQFKKNEYMEYTGTYLPHIQPRFEKFFVTFILHNEKTINYYKKIAQEKDQDFSTITKDDKRKEQIQRANINKKYFNKFDEFLNKLETEENYLSIPECSKIVVEKL
ncbi:MAG: hypothetical protein JXL97_02545 [Bacteroidales bacterium]|nr:hypothetical protein [Bacteroidales bacterium]